MSSRRLGWAAAVAVAVALLFAWRWWESDERRIHRAFDGLLASVERAGEETTLERLGHARDFAGRFANGFLVSARPYEGTITDRQQLMAIVDGYRAAAQRVRASGGERTLELRTNGTADIYSVITLDDGRAGRERFRVRISWIREDGEWKVFEAEILERIETSGLFG